jgi:hypothetical protein
MSVKPPTKRHDKEMNESAPPMVARIAHAPQSPIERSAAAPLATAPAARQVRCARIKETISGVRSHTHGLLQEIRWEWPTPTLTFPTIMVSAPLILLSPFCLFSFTFDPKLTIWGLLGCPLASMRPGASLASAGCTGVGACTLEPTAPGAPLSLSSGRAPHADAGSVRGIGSVRFRRSRRSEHPPRRRLCNGCRLALSTTGRLRLPRNDYRQQLRRP